MVEAMKQVAKMDVELTVEERNLLSVAYKNTIGARRASWRIISSIEQKEENKGNEQHVARIRDYRNKVSPLPAHMQRNLVITDELTLRSRTSLQTSATTCSACLTGIWCRPRRPASPRSSTTR